MMNADIVVKVHGRNATDLGQKIAAIDSLARTPAAVVDLPVDIPGVPPSVDVPDLDPPVLVAPYFDLGDATGKAGEIVELSVEGGCRFPMRGFHVGGGLAGYGKFEAVGFKLGPLLRAYLKSEDMIHDEPAHQHDHYWSMFQMARHDPHGALPTEWWDLGLGFFSLGEARGGVPSTTIPSGTEIFTLQVKILPETAPGEYDLSCLDVTYYTQSRHRRRDFLFMVDTESEFRRGGITKLELSGGKITVTD